MATDIQTDLDAKRHFSKASVSDSLSEDFDYLKKCLIRAREYGALHDALNVWDKIKDTASTALGIAEEILEQNPGQTEQAVSFLADVTAEIKDIHANVKYRGSGFKGDVEECIGWLKTAQRNIEAGKLDRLETPQWNIENGNLTATHISADL